MEAFAGSEKVQQEQEELQNEYEKIQKETAELKKVSLTFLSMTMPNYAYGCMLRNSLNPL